MCRSLGYQRTITKTGSSVTSPLQCQNVNMKQHHQLFRLSLFFSFRSCVFLVAAVFSGSTDASTHNKPKKIMAIVGESVILPCNVTLSDDLPTIEWSKDGQSPNIIFLYRDGCETFEMKHLDFRFRTNLLMTELKHGNLSLRISNLQPSDEGRYQCMVLQKKQRKVVSTLELVVGAVSEPKLSVVQGEDGVLTVQCELKHCRSSPPEIVFLDDQGKEMSAENPKTVPHTGECFSITRRMTAANSITCRVLHSEMNKIRDTKIYIPEICKTSCTQNIPIVVTVVTIGLICFIAAVLYIKYPNFESCCHVNQANHDRCAELLRENAELKFTLQGLIQQHSRSTIGSRSPPSERCLTPGPTTEKSTHGSCPSLLTTKAAAAAPPASQQKHRGRSRSVSEPQPQSSGAKTQRRNTISHNRFSPLEDLSEDSELLISGGEER
ncbi:V-set domain-containing T-cell activation inhibitor 1-like isoform X1 [Amphiprion ocellaris]|uniref:V-set domain-containing T-cell activation inhibitor 1-like isoform X1 n=1 Tax=Amphiprion ocellaris TaxID=80972 RepID=UPI0024117655|nr:V-set domain-containing T-cell activation inhibitor 1-like isoform X1 [Amphiprion ocellaris]